MRVQTEADALTIAAEALRGHPDEHDTPYTVERCQDLGWLVLTRKRPTPSGGAHAAAVTVNPETGEASVGGYQMAYVDLEL